MASHKTHILFVTPAFPDSESQSHSVVYFANFIKALKKINPDHKVSIISLQLPEKRKDYQWNGIDVHAMGTYGQAKWKKVKTWREVSKLASKIHEKEKISIVHALWLKECAFISNRIASKLKVPNVCTVMGMELRGKNKFLKIINLKKMHLVFVSPRHYELHKNQLNPNTKTDVIPWGIDTQSINTDLNMDKKYDLLFVGFLNDNKNLNLFVDIVEKLKSQNKQLRALVIGDFFNLHEWKHKVEKRNLSRHIEFKGLVPNSEVLELMKQSKILLHTSNYESLGYVMLEALSQGMHVVSKAVGIAQASERWHICEELPDFTSCISNLLRNYEAKFGIVPYSVEDTVGHYLSLYSKYSN